MNLSNLKSPKGARRNVKRLGRGESSGRGKTSGRGHKGQGSRSGSKFGANFEGGQMPLFRRIPKFGFTPRNKIVSAVVNLKDLEARYESGTNVDRTSLAEKGLIKKSFSGPIKILGTGAIKKKLNVKVAAFSKSAMTAIQNAGGTAEVVK